MKRLARMTSSVPLFGLAFIVAAAGCSGSVETGAKGKRSRPDEKSGGSGGQGGQDPFAGDNTPGIDAPPVQVVNTTRFARLTHLQWQRSVVDLLHLQGGDLDLPELTDDPVRGKFVNNGEVLQVTEGLWADYQQASETLALRVSRNEEALARILPPDLAQSGAQRMEGFLTGFGLRAFRRPLNDGELAAYIERFSRAATLYGTDGKNAFRDGVRLTIEVMLQSPAFLYRQEWSKGAEDTVALDSYEVASKLSYALANTMPDDELLSEAAVGTLTDKTMVKKQAKRLLEGQSGFGMVDDFHEQFLRMQTYDGIEKDAKIFPNAYPGMGKDLRAETLAFVRAVVFEDQGGLADLFTSPYTFVNAKTAPIYGVQGEFGGDMTRVNLDGEQRAGLLTQLGFLASNAHPDEVDSIHRGVFVHRQILCTELPPPADNVSLPSGGGKTNRERIENHTGDGTCGAGCHSRLINPMGFAFEHYDAVGAYREEDRGEPINARDAYAFDDKDEESFDGALELSRIIANTQSAHDCFTRHWLEYLHAREPIEEDDGLVARVSGGSRAGVSVQNVITELVTSDPFLRRISQ